jgi:hypothetical protein
MQPQTRRTISPKEARAIAKEAYIYGFPLVGSYRIQYSYLVDRNNREYKAPWNQIFNNPRVYTPADKAIQTPNSDTPYSYVGADLRTEPLVIKVPEIPEGRYYSIQFIDMYTFNFAYVGSRTTGNGAGSFLLAGPKWTGEKPAGIKDVIRSETEFAFAIFRTQLFEAADIENVKEIQTGYKVQTLSQFLGQPPPPAAPEVNFLVPLSPDDEKSVLEYFIQLNFIFHFCPTHRSEKDLMARFAKLGIGAGQTFNPTRLSPEIRRAIRDGISDAWKEFDQYHEDLNTGKIPAGITSGSRAFLKNNYMYRMLTPAIGIYANSREEAFYPVYFLDSDGKRPNGKHRYTLRFASNQLPPANAFWSLTLYELPSSLLSANPLQRYLINSPMLPQLKRDTDGGITLYLQHDSPGTEKDSNWLPAPTGPFFCVLRMYWPKPEAYDCIWKQPPLERVK